MGISNENKPRLLSGQKNHFEVINGERERARASVSVRARARAERECVSERERQREREWVRDHCPVDICFGLRPTNVLPPFWIPPLFQVLCVLTVFALENQTTLKNDYGREGRCLTSIIMIEWPEDWFYLKPSHPHRWAGNDDFSAHICPRTCI